MTVETAMETAARDRRTSWRPRNTDRDAEPRRGRVRSRRPSDHDATRRTAADEIVFDLQALSCFYGAFRAVRDISLQVPQQPDHGHHRPVRLRQEHGAAMLQPDERPDHGRTDRGSDPVPRRRPLRRRRRPGRGAAPDRHGLPEAEPVPEERSTTTSPSVRASPASRGRHGRAGRALAAPRRPVGRGQGQAQAARHGALRRPAAAALHRAGDRRRAGGDPDGRAVLRPRPDRHAADRGADARARSRTTRSSS